MRDYAKVGPLRFDKRMSPRVEARGKVGKPGYRTPAVFRQKVFAIVAKIPKGETMTYAQVAQKAGRPKACRAVGNVLSKNFDPKIPCHRVVRSDGKVGGYNRGETKKIELLKKEAKQK